MLLVTHVFYWAVSEPWRLLEGRRQLIEVQRGEIYVSAVTAWEIAIKVKIGKWSEAAGYLPGIAAVAVESGFTPLGITMEHAERAGSLPLHHRDPFDRLLAAQSLVLGVPIMSNDPVVERVGCTVI